MNANASPVVNLIILALAVVVAVVAYTSSESFKKKNGVTPWHWPSWLWAVVGFVSLLLCLILFMIASRRTKPVTAPASGSTPGDSGQPLPTPAYASAVTDQNGWGQGSAPSVPFPGATTPSPGVWHADPTGRFASRYWDGARWTEHVSDGNSTTTDPL